MTQISVPALDVYLLGHEELAPELPEERCVRTSEDRANLPKGTITYGADACIAVAEGRGGFQSAGMEGVYSPEEGVVLPAYIIAGPDLPALVTDGGVVFSSQAEVDQVDFPFYAVDANGALFCWEWIDNWEGEGPLFWTTAGQKGVASPLFPITAWR